MNTEEDTRRRGKAFAGVYDVSMGISMTAIGIVAAMEVFMLGYSVINAPLYTIYLWRYRIYYICLLVAALAYIGLGLYAKQDLERRYIILNVANPIYVCFFFAWALAITRSDAAHWGTVDPMVFMTFSLVVLLAFYVPPVAYAVIVSIADIFMISLVVTVSYSFAAITNFSIFCVFQIVLGCSFLQLRKAGRTHLRRTEERISRRAYRTFEPQSLRPVR